jgi:hypothetical protein
MSIFCRVDGRLAYQNWQPNTLKQNEKRVVDAIIEMVNHEGVENNADVKMGQRLFDL